MPRSYGYLIWKVFLHKHGRIDEPLRLGTLQPLDSTEETPADGPVALRTFYGVLRGLVGSEIKDASGEKRITVKSVNGDGQCVRFSMDLGRSGEESDIFDPGQDQPVFQRKRHHIDTTKRRGMLVLPDRSPAGLLILEAHGRGTGKDLLAAELKRIVKAHTDRLITEFPDLADPGALAEYLKQADIKRVTLKRTGVPEDIANGIGMLFDEAEVGRLELQIKQSRRFPWRRDVLTKLLEAEGDQRRQMLTVNGLEYQELNVQVAVGRRRTTVSVTGQQAPSFIYLMDPADERPSDDVFYAQVNETVADVAEGAGVRLGSTWASQPWSEASRGFIIERPAQEESDESANEGP